MGLFCGEVSGCHSTPSVFEIWVRPTEALGSAKEAHRRWPEGRSEQGASKAKDGPPIGLQPRSGVFRTLMRLPRQRLSQSRRLCSPLLCDSALRILGGFILRHDPIFSRESAFEGSMTVSGVQAAGVAWAVFRGEVSGCHSTPSVFDIWAMPEDGPPIFQPRSGGR